MKRCIETSGTRVLLIRHGQTEWNRTHRFQGRSDVPLNQTGRAQAHALGVALKDEPIKAMHSSPLIRAMETARLIKAFHEETPLFEEEDLVEMDLGDFDGMDAWHWAEQYPDLRKAWWKNPVSVKMPGGESIKEVQVRAINAVQRISRLYQPGSTLLICSHNFVNLAILCYALDISLDRLKDLQQGTAALNILYVQGDRIRVDVVDDQSHRQKQKKH